MGVELVRSSDLAGVGEGRGTTVWSMSYSEWIILKDHEFSFGYIEFEVCGKLNNGLQKYLCPNPWNLSILPSMSKETLQV